MDYVRCFIKKRGFEKIFRKIIILCFVISFLTAGISTTVAINTMSEEQSIIPNEVVTRHDLYFETQPGGATVTLDGVGSKTTSAGSTGTCTFYNLEEGTYDWSVSKEGFVTESGTVDFGGWYKICVSLGKEGEDLDAGIYFPPYWNIYASGRLIEGTIPIGNVGSDGSKLDWEITHYPSFGTNWNFNPGKKGEDLTTDGSPLMLDVSFTCPLSGSYSDYFEIVNRHNPTDTVTLLYALHVVCAKCCFSAGTEITMENGSYKKIEDIDIGDKVLGYNPNNNSFYSWGGRNNFKSYPSSVHRQ